jgi:hypothetical protein
MRRQSLKGHLRDLSTRQIRRSSKKEHGSEPGLERQGRMISWSGESSDFKRGKTGQCQRFQKLRMSSEVVVRLGDS